MRYLPSNLKASEIASELTVSTNTIRTHLRHIYAKLDAHGRAEAVARARELGLLAPAAPALTEDHRKPMTTTHLLVGDAASVHRPRRLRWPFRRSAQAGDARARSETRGERARRREELEREVPPLAHRRAARARSRGRATCSAPGRRTSPGPRAPRQPARGARRQARPAARRGRRGLRGVRDRLRQAVEAEYAALDVARKDADAAGLTRPRPDAARRGERGCPTAARDRGPEQDLPGLQALRRRFRRPPGEIVALVGQNGSGKSTLVKILAGVETRPGGARARARHGHVIHQDLG